MPCLWESSGVPAFRKYPLPHAVWRWRGELGWWRYTDRGPYKRLGCALLHMPAALLKRDSYERARPLLEAADSAAFLAGKWVGAVKERVLFL